MAFSIASTLEKMNSRDKDFRYMATADLVAELNKDTFKIDADYEKKLTTKVLQLLEDNSNTVQELVVRCLGPLSKKVREPQLQDIVDTLSNHLLNDKKGGAELRDISSIGIRTVIFEIPTEPVTVPQLVIRRLTPRLINGISMSDEKQEIVGYCLEAMNDLLSRFGALMIADHEKILKVVQPQLSSKRSASRKKAIGCLGHLASTIPDELFADLVKNLLALVDESAKNPEKLRTYIQAVGAIARTVGYRLGKFLPEICTKIIYFCEGKHAKESDDELREACFQCFESLIAKCPKDITPYLEKIIQLSLQYVDYDPNYVGDSDNEDADDMDTDQNDEEEEDEQEEQEDYSDDDDMSWKVRRSSVKCLGEVIKTRPEMSAVIYGQLAPAIIGRFKEREENVKLDVFSTFVDLLKQTGQVSRRNPDSPSLGSMRELIPKIVAGITKQLKEKSVKTRSGAFALLRELVVVLPGALTDHIAALVSGIQYSLGDKNSHSNLKIEALAFLRLLLHSHPADAFYPHIKVLAPPVFKCARDPYYRISAEALRVCSELVKVLRPSENSTFDYKPYAKDLFAATVEKVNLMDIDQEVKESAIHCVGLVVANFGNELGSELQGVLKVLVERLSNEITRLTAVKAFETIASSPLHVDLSAVLPDVVRELASFLRKANRQLKQSSLTALGAIVKNYGADKKTQELFDSVLQELAPLVSDADLHLSHLALTLSANMIQVSGSSSSAAVSSQIIPKALELLKSSLLQGYALESLLSLFAAVVHSNNKNLGFDFLLQKLMAVAEAKDVNKSVLLNSAKSVAALVNASPADVRNKTVVNFIGHIEPSSSDASKHLALYCLGEIGRRTDLSAQGQLQSNILACFDSSNEEIRQAASFALGNIAVGSLEKYLPQILQEIQKNPKIKYLLMHSLREIIVRQSASKEGVEGLKKYQDTVLPLLFENCESPEEGTRNVVAECLGKLALVSPNQLVPALVERIESANAFTRATVVTALKFSIVDRSSEVDSMLVPQMPKFLNLLNDKDLNVRKHSLLSMNYAAHNKPQLIRDSLPQTLPLVFAESKVKPELIREVDLGPFKHKVDDGLEIRKAAYETMYTLLDTCLDRIDIPAFIGNLVDGLKDHYDIKMLSHLTLIRLSQVSPAVLLDNLHLIIEPLRATLSTKVKEGAVKQEVDRNDEMIRSALRAIFAISLIPNLESNVKWEEFMRTAVRTGELAEKYAAIKAEGEHAESSVDSMEV
eukprot:TRINITY_DN9265_c1_g3_i1.p1 TRINITY_DN9265_c1_g3~~TRINITY_DN9265_c1_g3_i1.p1  ORF type:complete len:1236 (-),score=487.10 TRINITY_DN9265_c1_g3_i1:55-3762(-)